jgi:hypothetical protein
MLASQTYALMHKSPLCLVQRRSKKAQTDEAFVVTPFTPRAAAACDRMIRAILLGIVSLVIAEHHRDNGAWHLRDHGQQALQDERTHVDFGGHEPRGPRECNAAFASPIYRSAVNAMFGK